ncbi:flippase [uncultured Aquimarina sp.]|uniref:flippase n=1 Tax=uncultured Aquimarina sp. TaxID=575652 RepID=UPI002633810D|nr:flippase [uncultured Aquimarina sp.]
MIKAIFNKANTFFKNKFTNSAIYLLVEKVIRLIGNFIIFSEIAKYLGPSNFGIYNYSLAVFVILLTIANYGIHSLLVKYLCQKEEQKYDLYLGSAFAIKFSIGLFCLIFIWCSYPLFFEDDIKGQLIFIVCLGLVFQSFSVIECWFEAKVENKVVSIIKIIFFLIYAFIIILSIKLGISLVTLCYLYVLEIVLRSIALVISYQKSGRNIFNFKIDRTITKDLLKNGLPLLLSSIAGIIYLKIDQIMIGEILNDNELGYYSGAVRFAEAIYFVPWIIANAIFPKIIENKNKNIKQHYIEFQKFASYFIYSSFFIALFLYSISYYLILFVLGDDYTASLPILKIHAWSIIFISLRCLVNKWFVLEGMYNKLFLLEIFGGLTNVALNIVLIPYIGISGAAFTSLFSYALISYFGLLFFKKSRKVFYIFTNSIFNPYYFIISKLQNRD